LAVAALTNSEDKPKLRKNCPKAPKAWSVTVKAEVEKELSAIRAERSGEMDEL
jgi:hypothetical protein